MIHIEIETAKANNLNPFKYLEYIFEKLSQDAEYDFEQLMLGLKMLNAFAAWQLISRSINAYYYSVHKRHIYLSYS
ncbi:MAG: transposase domain-containing protein [Lentihominibacter sp.]